MSVHRELTVAIPRSTGITVNRGDKNKVLYVLEAPFNRIKGYAEPKRTTIGYAVDETHMYPTDRYIQLFPAEWEKASGKKAEPQHKYIGMYAATQAVCEKTGLGDILTATFHKKRTNAILDYAMYSVIFHSDSTSMISNHMGNQMMFCGDPMSDSYYSELFNEKITDAEMLSFKKDWALQCKKEGASEVWLCIDGSNDDCRSKGVDIAEKGHAKSHKNVNIVSFTYAITTDGLPVTFEIYRGGLVDAKAMKKILDFLTECGITLRGVILDRGYCDRNTLKYLNNHSIPYIIMIKGNPDGYTDTVENYVKLIKMNAEYLVTGTHLFGAQQEIKLFKDYNHTDYVNIYFDYRNATDRVESLLNKVYKEMERIQLLINGGEKYAMDSSMKDLLDIDGDGEAQRVIVKADILQKKIDEKGLYGIVSSEKKTPEEIHKLYSSRGTSETQYMQIKTQLGYGKMGVHYTKGVRAKFMIGFVASIIRYEIECAAKSSPAKLTVNEAVAELNKLEMERLNRTYAYTHTENYKQIGVLTQLGASTELLDDVVKDENNRNAGNTPAPRHKKPGPKKNTSQKTSKKSNASQAKRGVKAGTRRPAVNKDGSIRKKPGVPVGTKRGEFNKDGSPRKKSGPKPGTVYKKRSN